MSCTHKKARAANWNYWNRATQVSSALDIFLLTPSALFNQTVFPIAPSESWVMVISRYTIFSPHIGIRTPLHLAMLLST
jgi:hypothetical protein